MKAIIKPLYKIVVRDQAKFSRIMYSKEKDKEDNGDKQKN